MSRDTRHVRYFEIEEGYTIGIDRRWRDIGSHLGAAASDVATNIGKCVDVLFWLTEQLEQTEARFRAWKAAKKLNSLRAEPKRAEWKCKDDYRASPDYARTSNCLARIRADIVWIEGMQASLETKAYTINTFVKAGKGSELVGNAIKMDPQAPGPKRGRVRPTRRS